MKRIIFVPLIIFNIFFNCLTYNAVSQSVITNFSLWGQKGNGTWQYESNTSRLSNRGRLPKTLLTWIATDKASVGSLISPVFTITKPLQVFDMAGLNGMNASGENAYNIIMLRAYPGDDTLRQTITNGLPGLITEKWFTKELIGKKVYIEIKSNTLFSRFKTEPTWIAFENHQQAEIYDFNDISDEFLQAVNIDKGASPVLCRSIPFLAANKNLITSTSRQINGLEEIIPVNAQADIMFLLGMINEGWENGVAHWMEHPELNKNRTDLNNIGNKVGTLKIKYVNGETDTLPLVVGSTIWFSAHWSNGGSHSVTFPCREPFATRPELMKIFRDNLLLFEDNFDASPSASFQQFYLSIKPRQQKIASIVIEDSPLTRGKPLVSGITILGKKQKGLYSFGTMAVSLADITPKIDVEHAPDIYEHAALIGKILYTREENLPNNPELVSLPKGLDATSIRFKGGKEAAWLSNIWAANLAQINDKFDSISGFFDETGVGCPWYGGYSGIGTWAPIGVYQDAYSRTSDHYVTLALRCLNNPMRESTYTDYCDKYLYLFRNNRDSTQGPPNQMIDADKYPADAPPHWNFVLGNASAIGSMLNEIPGDEEMDGHASNIVGRYIAWKMHGMPREVWLTKKRSDTYGKSRWQSTKDATEFICWLMDYTGRDVVYSEGEFTGWGGPNFCEVPKKVVNTNNRDSILWFYANANMYQPYPNFTSLTALKCAAVMADSLGETEVANRWRAYADRISRGMLRQLIAGHLNELTWCISPYSILSSFQDRLVQAWFTYYFEGLDNKNWNQEMLGITRNTFYEHMRQIYDHKPVLAMGYGQGWLTHAALLLDEMDDASPLLVNLAKYTYDKNMDYVDESRGIDWRKWSWIVPEGSNILPDGSWHRINDLSNGANQGPAMQALLASAGIDDTNPQEIKILPRIPEPLTGIDVENAFIMLPAKGKLQKARINYSFDKSGGFKLTSDLVIPNLAVRLGPYPNAQSADALAQKLTSQGFNTRTEMSGKYKKAEAYWVWVKELKDISKVNINL